LRICENDLILGSKSNKRLLQNDINVFLSSLIESGYGKIVTIGFAGRPGEITLAGSGAKNLAWFIGSKSR